MRQDKPGWDGENNQEGIFLLKRTMGQMHNV